jgi:hypothetical protein
MYYNLKPPNSHLLTLLLFDNKIHNTRFRTVWSIRGFKFIDATFLHTRSVPEFRRVNEFESPFETTIMAFARKRQSNLLVELELRLYNPIPRASRYRI